MTTQMWVLWWVVVVHMQGYAPAVSSGSQEFTSERACYSVAADLNALSQKVGYMAVYALCREGGTFKP